MRQKAYVNGFRKLRGRFPLICGQRCLAHRLDSDAKGNQWHVRLAD